MTLILRPTTGPEDWKGFLAQPELHWKSGRSAMETAYSWENANGLPAEIAALFGPAAGLLLAVPEFKVGLPGGTRKSQNDVFALISTPGGLITCMIEAKRDEPFGPTLSEWLQTASAGKTERLAAICGLLGLDPDMVDPHLRYQLFHRAASAVITARRYHTRHAAMVVQSFSPQKRWFADFSGFAALFGCQTTPDRMVRANLPDGMILDMGWASCPLATLDLAT